MKKNSSTIYVFDFYSFKSDFVSITA